MIGILFFQAESELTSGRLAPEQRRELESIIQQLRHEVMNA